MLAQLCSCRKRCLIYFFVLLVWVNSAAHAQNKKTLAGYWYCPELRQEVVIKQISATKFTTVLLSQNIIASTPSSGDTNIASQTFRPTLTPARKIYPGLSSSTLQKAISYGLICQAIIVTPDDNEGFIELVGPAILSNSVTKQFRGFGPLKRYRWSLFRQDVDIAGMNMTAPSVLSIYLSSGPIPKPRSVTISTQINGKAIKFAQSVAFDALGHGVVEVDFQKYQVPKFDDNVTFKVEAISKSISGANVTKSTDVLTIPLPMVLVPGIVGVGNPQATSFKNLVEKLQNKKTKNLLPYKEYTITSDNKGYYTIFNVKYDRNNSTFVEGAREIDNQMTLINSLSYAKKYNIVSHSKGCLVTREFMSQEGLYRSSSHVKFVLLCQGPHLGSILASVLGDAQILQLHTTPNNEISDLLDPSKWGPTNIKYKNLSPVYPWIDSNGQIPEGSPNIELEALNQKNLLTSADYVIVYSDAYPTLTTIIPPGKAKPFGDAIVPWFSQRGFTPDGDRIAPFANLGSRLSEKKINVTHLGLDGSDELIAFIISKFGIHDQVQ